MRQLRGQLTFSATDLSRFLACGHLTNLRRELALGLRERPRQVDDPRTELLRRRGIEHEERLLAAYRDRGLRVEAITETDAPDGGDRDAARVRTVEAMRRGADVIYQGRLEEGRWSGYPDFLLRVDAPSALGAWSYEVVDAKLARIARGEALLQLLLYSDLLQRVQAAAPERMHLALGGGGGRLESFRIAEHAAYYRVVRQRFEAHVDAPPETRPEPVAHCELCDWQQDCRAHWRSVDHLSLVAGISVDQRRRLTGRGIETLAALATVPLPATPRIDGIDAAALARIREQARVQLEARQRGRRIRELITPVAADKGLASLPAPSRDDIFAAIQGDLYTGDDGLEYLFGFVDREERHEARWALDKQTERCTFEQFIDGVMDRWQREPGFHLYHYGSSVPTAVKRLMSRYATREDTVDRLLRGSVFVEPAPRRAPGTARLGRELRPHAAGAVLWLRAAGRSRGRHPGARALRGLAGVRQRGRPAGPAGRSCAARSNAATGTTAARPGASPTGWKRAGASWRQRPGWRCPARRRMQSRATPSTSRRPRWRR